MLSAEHRALAAFRHGLRSIGADPGDRPSFEPWVRSHFPHFEFAPHNRIICRVLDEVERGERKRVIITIPPRIGKSEPVSRLWPAFLLANSPARWVGLASYAAGLATGLSRNARDNYVSATGDGLTTTARDFWTTARGGGMWSAGRGGTIIGRGYDFGIIDDPIKNNEEALSQAVRSELQSWYRGTWITRQHPDAAIVVVMQRWEEDDFIGFLFDQEDKSPQHWHVVAFDAIHSDASYGIPSTCTLEPDWREPGEPIWPQRFSLEDMQNRIDQADEWGPAIYQQRPQSASAEGRVVPGVSEVNFGTVQRVAEAPIAVGIDFNVEPMSGLVFQTLAGPRLEYIAEYQLHGSDTDDLARRIRADWPACRDAYPDPSGAARSTNGPSDHDTLRAHGFRVHARPKAPPHRIRAGAVNRLARRSTNGVPGLLVDPQACPIFARALRKLRWKPGTSDIDKSDPSGHAFDAGTYPIDYLFPVQLPRRDRKYALG